MGLIRGGLLFVISSLVMILLLAGNVFLTFSLSLEENSLQSEIISEFSTIGNQEINFTKEVENNFDSLVEHCENNTNFEFSQEGYVVDIPCEVVDQGPEAVVEEGFNDIIEGVIEEQYPDSLLGSFSKLFFSSNASDYWKSYFYITLGIIFVLVLIMFFIVEKKLNLPITMGFLLIISSLPFAIANLLLPLFTKSFLKPLSILFSESYFVFLVALILGIFLIIIGFGLKFFKFGWSLSERFGKIKMLFNKKSESKEVKK